MPFKALNYQCCTQNCVWFNHHPLCKKLINCFLNAANGYKKSVYIVLFFFDQGTRLSLIFDGNFWLHERILCLFNKKIPHTLTAHQSIHINLPKYAHIRLCCYDIKRVNCAFISLTLIAVALRTHIAVCELLIAQLWLYVETCYFENKNAISFNNHEELCGTFQFQNSLIRVYCEIRHFVCVCTRTRRYQHRLTQP